ncbi:hypothetical protein U1Q18_050775 [Sarracenia purpurea var. burkii]
MKPVEGTPGQRDYDRGQVDARLYSTPPLPKRAKCSKPELDPLTYKILQDQIRMSHGLNPLLVRKNKMICYMESPKIRPKSNFTTTSRNNHIKQWMEERKYSDDNQFSARCKSDHF